MTQLLLAFWILWPNFSPHVNADVNEVPEPIIYEWDEDFTEADKRKMFVWLDGASNAVFDTLGYYPFSIHVYMHKSTSRNEPVPWANTVRGEKQGVHFHVNPDYALNGFFKDWTATHEISHLSIPFVGKENMWFSEGFASFMQWYILQHQGYFTIDEVHEKYRAKLIYALEKFDENTSFVSRADNLLKAHDYPAVYWGGATYFFQVNEELKQNHNTNLFAVIKLYQVQNRMIDRNIDELIHSLDEVSNTKLFSRYFSLYTTKSARETTQNTLLP